MPAVPGSLGTPKFARDIPAIGAKQQYAVYDREFPATRATMQLRFDLYTDVVEPHHFSPDPVGTGARTIGTSTFVGSSSIPKGIKCGG